MKKILILFTSIFLVGCSSYKELNNSAIVSAIGIDYKDNNYIVSMQIIDTSKNSNEQNNLKEKEVYSAKGKSISEAVNDISFKSPKMLYLGHLELVIISEDLALNGTEKITDYFLRNNEIDKNFTILISKDTNPIDILSSPTVITNFPSGNILGSVEISSTIGGVSSNVKFLNYVDDLMNQNKNPVMSSIKLIKEDEKSYLQIDDLAVFNNDKLLGFLDKNDTKGYNFITDNIKTAVIDFKCDNNNSVGIKINNNKTKLKANLKIDKPEIIIDVNSTGTVIEDNCDYNINDIKKHSIDEIKSIILNSINKVKEEFNSDIFGFGEVIYMKSPKYFKKLQNDYLMNINYVIDVNIKFDNSNNILD